MSKRDEMAKEWGDRHAIPIIRSLYPSKSRGEMAREFSQLFTLGWDACAKDAEAREAQLVNLVREFKSAVDSLFSKIEHGDTEHRAWLYKAIESHFEKARAKLKELNIYSTEGEG